MKVSGGVVIISCITFVGSTLTFLLGVMMGAFIFLPMPAPSSMPNQPPFPMEFFKVIFIIAALMYIAPAVWGFASGVGLLKAKNWARISTIVFSILLICHSAFSMLMTAVVMFSAFGAFPSSEKIDPSVPIVVGGVMAFFWLSQMAIGVWWLVYLTRPRVKAQFVRPAQVAHPLYGTEYQGGIVPQYANQQQISYQPILPVTQGQKRPISVTIIAWWILIASAFVPINLLMGMPAVFLTKIFTGWPAAVFYLAVAGLHVYIGVGLLKLQPAARATAIAWFIFGFLNNAVFVLAPGRNARMSALFERSMRMYPWINSQAFPFRFDITPFVYVGMIFGMALLAIPLYFLITDRKAFQPAT